MLHAGVTFEPGIVYFICVGWTDVDPEKRKYSLFIVDSRNQDIVYTRIESTHARAVWEGRRVLGNAGAIARIHIPPFYQFHKEVEQWLTSVK